VELLPILSFSQKANCGCTAPIDNLSGLPVDAPRSSSCVLRTDCTRAQGSIDLARRVNRPVCITSLRRFANGLVYAQYLAPHEVAEKMPTPEIAASGFPHFPKKFPRKSSRDFSPQLLMPLQVAMHNAENAAHAPYFLAAGNAGHYIGRNSLLEGNLLVIAEKRRK